MPPHARRQRRNADQARAIFEGLAFPYNLSRAYNYVALAAAADGRLSEAIDILQKAAVSDPVQAEIQEHLGDALYSAGRRFEARFAWQAALATAEDEDTARLKTKIETGLTQATAAP